VVNAPPRPLYPWERPGTHCIGGWVGLRAGLDRCGKCRLHRDLIPGPSSPQRVAIAPELSRPTGSQARIVNNSSKYFLYSLLWVVLRLLNLCADVSEHCSIFIGYFLLTPPMRKEHTLFWNVGTWNSDAGESPKSKNTACRIRRKLEIKNSKYLYWVPKVMHLRWHIYIYIYIYIYIPLFAIIQLYNVWEHKILIYVRVNMSWARVAYFSV